jgi:hypothetical protein
MAKEYFPLLRARLARQEGMCSAKFDGGTRRSAAVELYALERPASEC